MRRCFAWLVATCCLAWTAAALAPAQESKPTEDEVMQLISQYEVREHIWSQTRTPDDEPDWAHAPAGDFMPRFKALADKYAGKPQGLLALSWMLEHAFSGPGTDGTASARWAVERLARDYAADARVGKYLERLAYMRGAIEQPVLLNLFDQVMAKNPDKETASTAAFCKGMAIMEALDDGAPSEKQRTEDRAQALELFRKVVHDAAGTSLAKQAETYIFQAEHLQIGMIAPDFSGTGVDGQELKLSQFRGRVVVVDFWGFW